MIKTRTMSGRWAVPGRIAHTAAWLACFTAFLQDSFAASILWDGSALDGLWGNKDNWTPAQVPTTSDTVAVGNAGTVVVQNAANAASLTLDPTTTLSILGSSGASQLTIKALDSRATVAVAPGVAATFGWSYGQYQNSADTSLLSIGSGGSLAFGNWVSFSQNRGTVDNQGTFAMSYGTLNFNGVPLRVTRPC